MYMNEAIDDLEEVAKIIHKAIFSKKKEVQIANETFSVEKLSSGLRYVDYSGLRFLEQNRRKKSQWGKKAREGHEITWILKGRKYLGQVFDGEFRNFAKNEK